MEIPEDIASEPSQLHHEPTGLNRNEPVASPERIARVQRLIADAEAPVGLAGAGTQIGNIPNALAEFASKTGIGVVATQMGKGSLPEDHPQSLRSMSLNSGDVATRSLEQADLILAVGFQPVEHPPSSFNPDDAKRIVRIDSPNRAPLPAVRGSRRRYLSDLAQPLLPMTSPMPTPAL